MWFKKNKISIIFIIFGLSIAVFSLLRSHFDILPSEKLDVFIWLLFGPVVWLEMFFGLPENCYVILFGFYCLILSIIFKKVSELRQKKKILAIAILIIAILHYLSARSGVKMLAGIIEGVFKRPFSCQAQLIKKDKTIKFSVTNNSCDIIIPLKLESSKVALLNWVTPIYGSLVFDESKNTFTHNALIQMQSADYFYSWFLFPREEEVFSLEVSFSKDKKPDALYFYYYRLNQEDFLRQVYVPRGPAGKLPEEFGNLSLNELKRVREKKAVARYFLIRGKEDLVVYSEEVVLFKN